jgi:CDP-4-dehydro-6-deoxyglucose reductase, E3
VSVSIQSRGSDPCDAGDDALLRAKLLMADIVTTAGKRFSAHEGESILDAALRHGVALEYSCQTGRCSTCKAQLRAGLTTALHEESGLSPTERTEGWILTCVRSATSEVVIEVEDLGEVRMFPAKTFPCRIHGLEHLSADVIKVVLRLPPSAEFEYYPGQYIDVMGHDGLRRSYSIANAPDPSRQLELHVRRVPEGRMSDYWFGRAKVNDLLRLRGPLGTFFLRQVSELNLAFLATGTGIAPIKAMLEGLAAGDPEDRPASIQVCWGGRVPQDMYWDSRGIGLQHEFVSVLSRADGHWTGARGHVQDTLLSLRPDLHETAVYACGSDAMVRDARRMLIDAGLSARRFHSDAFLPSGAM